jgi:cytoskeletal protein CcmA (bactofilin family)
MFNQKTKSDISSEAPVQPSGASIIAAGTTVKGDISSTGDIRIDGTLQGNVQSTAKVVIGANGVVDGDISGQQADIMGKINGTIKVKELLQLKGGSAITGNIHAAKLQIETNANFNGQCHMTGSGSAPAKPASSANTLNEQKSEKSVVADTTFSLK